VVSSLTERRRSVLFGAAALIAAFLVLWLCARDFDAGRPDFFYLADAFLHGRTWLERALGPYDVVIIAGRVFVPFAPFLRSSSRRSSRSPVSAPPSTGSRSSMPCSPVQGSASSGGWKAALASARRSIARGCWCSSASARRPGG